MYRVCIALVDATRARLLTFERVVDGDETHEALVERTDLMDLQGRRRPGEANGPLNDRFVRMALAALRELIDERRTHRVVLCASPQMLGRLRGAAPGLLPSHIALDELPRDLVALSPGEVQAELSVRALLSAAGWMLH
jgi:protein required for attachment to host cells